MLTLSTISSYGFEGRSDATAHSFISLNNSLLSIIIKSHEVIICKGESELSYVFVSSVAQSL